MRFKCRSDGGWFDRLSPFRFDAVDRRAAALGDIAHAGSEDTVDADNHFVAGFDQIDDGGFHAGASGSGGGEGHLVSCAEDVAKHPAGFVHDTQIFRIEMPDGRHCHRRKNARRDITGTGTEKNAAGSDEWICWLIHEGWHHPRLIGRIQDEIPPASQAAHLIPFIEGADVVDGDGIGVSPYSATYRNGG